MLALPRNLLVIALAPLALAMREIDGPLGTPSYSSEAVGTSSRAGSGLEARELGHPQDTVRYIGLDKGGALPGERITLTGKNLPAGLSAIVSQGGKRVTAPVVSRNADKLVFRMPFGFKPGPTQVSLMIRSHAAYSRTVEFKGPKHPGWNSLKLKLEGVQSDRFSVRLARFDCVLETDDGPGSDEIMIVVAFCDWSGDRARTYVNASKLYEDVDAGATAYPNMDVIGSANYEIADINRTAVFVAVVEIDNERAKDNMLQSVSKLMNTAAGRYLPIKFPSGASDAKRRDVTLTTRKSLQESLLSVFGTQLFENKMLAGGDDPEVGVYDFPQWTEADVRTANTSGEALIQGRNEVDSGSYRVFLTLKRASKPKSLFPDALAAYYLGKSKAGEATKMLGQIKQYVDALP